MPSIAGQSQMGALRFNFRSLVLAAVPPLRTSAGRADALAARAIASAGLAAVLGLPVLLLFSIALNAPLAVPAAIASGYLVISHALASNKPRRAAFVSGIVLAALVGWLILYLFAVEEPLSHSSMVAAMMAPLFASAPALARSVMAPRAQPRPAVRAPIMPLSRATALERVACLDELAPFEAVVIVDREGSVLAATQAARRRLGLLPDAFEHPITSVFEPAEMPGVADALRRCKEGGESVEVAGIGTGRGRSPETWMASPNEGGAASLRFVSAADVEKPIGKSTSTDADAEPVAAEPPRPASDIGTAVAFALRQASPRAEAKGIAITVERDGNLVAACDLQIGRRITHLALEAALTVAGADGAIRIDARRLKGIVLLRVTAERSAEDAEAASLDRPFDRTTLQALIEGTGGTLVVDRREDRLVLSVRLDLADVATHTKGQTEDRAEAG